MLYGALLILLTTSLIMVGRKRPLATTAGSQHKVLIKIQDRKCSLSWKQLEGLLEKRSPLDAPIEIVSVG